MLPHHYATDNVKRVVGACWGSANAKCVCGDLLGEWELFYHIKSLGNLLWRAIQKQGGVVLEIGIVLVERHVVGGKQVVV